MASSFCLSFLLGTLSLPLVLAEATSKTVPGEHHGAHDFFLIAVQILCHFGIKHSLCDN
jgi:hypothetical protein